MTLVTMPFLPEMVSAIVAGGKICTTRKKEKGQVGDTFLIGSREYQIVDIWGMDLNSVIYHFYRLEGFPSKDDFWQYWRRLYTDDWTGDETVFLHFFAPVDGPVDASGARE